MLQRRSLGWPITLGVVMILLLVVLTVGWVVVTAYNGWWAVLAVGATLLGLVLAGVERRFPSRLPSRCFDHSRNRPKHGQSSESDDR